MTPLPKPPAEVPRISALDGLHPVFRTRLELIQADVPRVRVFETSRTNARQAYLYGFGREYDDGRGAVTRSASAMKSWHFYGLAADLVEDDATPWTAPMEFWQAIGIAAEKHGCVWGGRWTVVDLPHVQAKGIPVSPGVREQQAYSRGGLQAVWDLVNIT